ncbi:MAG: 4-hydroxythreonine-4-phosphate dehydrogenase PdxA [Hyphomonadaceae bacterium]|nr:4-hydroxythreonine-4-phosphate dehydrogenase PdxA [Hyphomonadaceae bacterium]
MAHKPIAVSMGDPAGVGLEIAARAFAAQSVQPGAPRFFLVGDANAAARAARRIGLDLPLRKVGAAAQVADTAPDALPVLHVPLAMEETPGEPDPVNAHAIIESIAVATAAAASGAASAIVTLPIAKAPLYQAGFPFPGHTEFVAHLCEALPYERTRGPVMLLAGEGLRVALATIHISLAEAIDHLSTELLIRTVRVVHEAMRSDFGLAAPRIALAGLNPHAGEGGSLGREELEIINPAAGELRAEGIDVADARPADTLFHAEARAGYDVAIAMYHDQGLIPVKTLDFWGAVNVTLGLPIVRTSPDHGTGFDIAGKGLARPESFIAALQMARDMAARRKG